MHRAVGSSCLPLTFVEESEGWDVGAVSLPEHQQLVLPNKNLYMIMAAEN